MIINEKSFISTDFYAKDLILAKKIIYDRYSFKYSNLEIEKEGRSYSACHFELNDHSVFFRIAKITPTKSGQFTTFWKRNKNGIIEPYDVSDKIDLLVISVRKDDQLGQFIFPKYVLIEHKILSINGKGGKRALRVYPPWDNDLNYQAQNTQNWQLKYFLEISETINTDKIRIQSLYLNF